MFHPENVFERTNGTLNSSSSGVEVSPIRRTTQDAGIETQVTVRVDVNAAAIFRRGAGIGTGTAQRAAGDRSMENGLGADKFQAF